MNDPASAAGTPARPWSRYVKVGAVLFVLAGAFFWFLWPTIEMKLAINGLASDDASTLSDMRNRLRSSTDPKVDAALEDAVRDGDRPWPVRVSCVDLLLQRQRLTQVESILRTGDLMARAVVLKRLAREGYFKSQVVPDPSFRVPETVLAWLGDAKAERRMEAIRLALDLGLDGALEHIRPLLVRSNAEGAGKADAVFTLIAAAEAVVRFKDCVSVGAVEVLAGGDKDVEVRLRTLEQLEQLSVGIGGGPPLCPDPAAKERLAGIVQRALDAPGEPDFARKLRIKALAMVQRHPEWLPANAARVWQALDGEGNGAERRAALAALVDGNDPGIAAAFPRYLHDREFEVRDEAVKTAGRVQGLAPAGLWIGTLRDETQTLAAVLLAHQNLKTEAGTWVGLPAEVLDVQRARAGDFDSALTGFVTEQFRNGSSRGLTRDAWSEAWFRWFAGRQGLEGDDVAKAVALRSAFRQAMDRNDVQAARAALAGARLPAPLFAYEEGWLASRSPSRP